jgi:predicted Zn-dependent protease
MKRAAITIILVLTALVGGCTVVQTTQPGAIGVNRKQYMFVSEEEVEKGSVEAYQQELTKARDKSALNTDPAALQRVRTISQRLIPQTTVFRPDAAKWNWEINVQKTDELNAYCMPGGKIMVYTGLIDKLKATDAELAAVLGHEMAHALREHARERVSQSYAQQAGLAVLGVATGVGDLTMQVASAISQVTFTLPHSREQEAEADRIGLELMARAGYDPHSAVTLWQKMNREAGSSGAEFLSTHPSSEARIKDLENTIPRVLPLYEAAKTK